MDDTLTSSLSVLVTRLVQVVWPAMAVVGGLDSGFSLGRTCMLEGSGQGEEAVIVSIPDAEQNVVVEKRIFDWDMQKLKRYVGNSNTYCCLTTYSTGQNKYL